MLSTTLGLRAEEDSYGSADDYKWADEFHTVYMYSKDDGSCKACEKAKKEFDSQPLPFRLIVVEKNFPKWLEGYPTLHWNDVNGKGVISEGWFGLPRFLERWKLSITPGYKNVKEVPPVVVRPALFYPGSAYNSIRQWPGDLYYHLTNVHGINATNFSAEQAEAAHDAAHGSFRRRR